MSLPTDVERMIELIEASYDRAGFVAALQKAQTEYDHCAAQLEAAQRQLAAHEATTPDNPASWALSRRRLSAVLPIYQKLAAAKAGELADAQRAIGDARLKVLAVLRDQLRRAFQRAGTNDALRVEELRREIDEINAGRSPEFQCARAAEIALHGAESRLRNPY
jgi:hypothetical protein